MGDQKTEPALITGISPRIKELSIKMLQHSAELGVVNFEAMEIFTRILISIALDAAGGDCAVAAKWIDQWLLPNIHHFRDHLAQGGSVLPETIDGHRVQ
jgi:hypothetical protein